MTACNNPTPDKCFGVSVLNTNLYVGFANDGFLQQFENPSHKLVEGTKDQTEPMKRVEMLNEKIRFVEENLEKIKSFPSNEDSKEVIEASIALHEFMLPAYQNEYRELAESFDSGALQQQTNEIARKIEEKYASKFTILYNDLIKIDKPFASHNNIKVHWADENM